MVTSVGKEKDLLEMLQDLVKLDLAAAEAYQEAVERLDNPIYKQQLAAFMRDHERHVEELTPVVRTMGGEPPDDAGAKEWLTEGKVALSSLGGDKSILKAMKSNENDTNIAYERCLDRAPLEARGIIERGLADERRHREWILQQLGEEEASETHRVQRDETRPGQRGLH